MLKFKTILVDFASWSTVACVRNIAFSKFKWLRFLWFLVFLAMAAGFIAQFVMIIQKYLRYEADTSNTIVFSSQPFPDVTICSFNPFKLSEVNKNADFAEIKKMLDEYAAAEEGTAGSDTYGFQGLDRFARLDKANDLLVFFAAKLTEAQKAPALYKVEELVTECLFAGNTCDGALFEAIPDPVYGRCFVYRGSTQTITRPGLAHGLRLIVTANLADSLTFVSDYLPTTSRVGVRMTINENNSIVELDNRGFNVGVGYQTSIALSKSRTERIKAPYGDCVDSVDPSMSHYAELPYTIDSCFTTCMQKRFVERCGCAHPTYRKADNETWCTTAADAECIATHRGDQLNSTDINLDMMADCGCKNPCIESYFSSTLSVLTYPAFGYTVGVGTTQQNQNQQQEQYSTTTTTSTTVITTTGTGPTTTTTAPTTSTTTTPSTSTTTKARTSTSTSTSTSTTPVPTTTTSNCGYSGDRLTAITAIVASGMFKVVPDQAPCTPRFECDPAYSKEWWKCWPCYYECPDGSRMPPAPWTTPNVKCSLFFNFAQIEMDYPNRAQNPTTCPGWNSWANGGQNGNPGNGECNQERNKINNPTWISDCNTIRDYASTSTLYNWNSGTNTLTLKTPTVNWYDSWPCSYPCSDGTRFPTKPAFSNVKCMNLLRCATIDLSPYVIKPTFNGWNDGSGTGYDCAAMKVPGASGGGLGPSGRKKRSVPVVTPPTPTTKKTTTVPLKSTTTVPTVKSMGMPGKGSCESWNKNFKSVDDCKHWYKNNGMIVNVYYESLEYQVLTENAAYSVSQAVNDLGGQAGLWLGLSVVSIVECVGLLLILLLFCVTGKQVFVRMEKEARYEDDDIMPLRK